MVLSYCFRVEKLIEPTPILSRGCGERDISEGLIAEFNFDGEGDVFNDYTLEATFSIFGIGVVTAIFFFFILCDFFAVEMSFIESLSSWLS